MQKNHKKSIAFLLAVLMAFCTLPFSGVTAVAKNSTAKSDIVIGDDTFIYELLYEWNDEEDEEYAYAACITGTADTLSGDVVIPQTLGGYPVEIIGCEAFKNRTNITSVVIPEGVKSIEGGGWMYEENNEESYYVGAFYGCTTLKNVSLPNSLIRIGSYAFYGCTALTDVTIPGSVEYVGGYAFYDCSSLKSVTLKNGIYSIDDRSFSYCTALTDVTIPGSVEYVGESAFCGCSSLKSVTLEGGVKTIYDEAFYDCTKLSAITLPDSIEKIGSNAFLNTAYYNDETKWENGVLYIGNHLIHANSSIPEAYTIKDTTKCIADYAFSWNDSLKEVTILECVSKISHCAFYACYSLEKVTIEEGITSIGSEAFSGCSKLSQVILPSSLLTIDDEAFSGCEAIEQISLPISLSEIGYRAFEYCNALSSVTFPEKLSCIGGSAFYGCSSLAEINIPSSVDYIGGGAFGSCSNLVSINIDSSNLSYRSEDNIIFNVEEHTDEDGYSWNEAPAIICYPAGKTDLSYTIPSGITEIYSYAFSGCSTLNSIIIPDSVEYISNNSFERCPSLKTISIPDSVRYISEYAFSNCSALESVKLPKNLTYISGGLFYGCSSLGNIVLPQSVEYIDCYAFQDCTSLNSIIIPDAVYEIGHDAFSNCSALKEINIPDSIRYIGESAFYGCSSLTEISLPYDFERIKDGTFYGCTSLSKVSIPATVKVIEYNAFYNCPALKSLVIPAGVETIEDYSVGYMEDIVEEGWYDCVKVPDFSVKGYNGSAAENYATENGLNFISIDGSHPYHTFGEWKVVKEPTVVLEGEKKRVCTVCGISNIASIEKLEGNTIINEDTGISLVYPYESYERYDIDELSLKAEVKTSGEAFDAVNAEKNFSKKTLYDIATFCGEQKVQPNVPVWVKIPLPDGYNESFTNVYYVTKNGYFEKTDSFVKDGYVYFKADHFSNYAIVEENPVSTCDHICHKGGIAKFFYKIMRFFWKMFKTNKTCKCGMSHY